MTRLSLSALAFLPLIASTSYGQDNYDREVIGAKPIVHKMTKAFSSRAEKGGTITTVQPIEFNGCYYEDIDESFGIPEIPGYNMTSATITLNFYDVDFYDQSVWSPPELDVVSIGDTTHAVDVLKGRNGTTTMTKNWNVLCQIKCNAQSGALGFQINVDAADRGWCLGLESATLTTEWSDDVAGICLCSAMAIEADRR